MKGHLTVLNVGIAVVGIVAVVFTLSRGGGAAPVEVVSKNLVGSATQSLLRQAKAASRLDYAKDVKPLLEEYCYDCHADGTDKGGLSLDKWNDEASLVADRKLWKEVEHQVGAKVMPPAKRKAQPTDAERAIIAEWIDGVVFYVDCSKPDPGRVTIRRLNRKEYSNTVRDLVGVNFEAAADFPPDDTGYGFDNIGDVLSISPVLLEKYLAAAEKVMGQAIRTEKPAEPTKRYSGDTLRGGGAHNASRILSTNGRITLRHRAAYTGEYLVRIRAAAHQAGKEPAKMTLNQGGKNLKTFDVANDPNNFKNFEFKLRLTKGNQDIAVEFINDFFDPKEKDPNRRDRNLLVDRIEVSGPLGFKGPPVPRFHREWLPEDPSKVDGRVVGRQIIEKFATRAFRRPVLDNEVDRLMALARQGSEGEEEYAFEKGIKLAMVAVLVSPNFLFRNEFQPNPDNPEAVYKINEHALAARLSYFLWSSMPDDELVELAASKSLRKNWDAQVRRMLADPRSRALTENFAGQWLQLRDLDLVNPDRKRFSEFDRELVTSMRKETETFFEYVKNENRSIIDFISADYTFANQRLAKHYGMGEMKGSELRKVSLKGSPRGGLLTHGSILTLTSNPTRTSPVKRGKWILENILGTPPPEAPANVPSLDAKGKLQGNLRERLEQHRADPNCASCHALMDPIGLAFENFDAIGRWRDKNEGKGIDTSAVLDTGEKIDGAADLRRVLAEKRSGQFTRTMTTAMMTYAIGRGMEYYDRCAIDKVVETVEKDGHRFESLVIAVTRSVPFQMRRGDGERK